jgi:bifunctional non-homologous end joining protein LigD
VERRPDLVTDAFRKVKREGRVMLDPSRNGTGATIVALYSPRARADAAVSFPVAVEELGSVSPGNFTIQTVPKLLDRPGPKRWRALASERGRLPSELLRPA